MTNNNRENSLFIETYTSGGFLIPRDSKPLSLRLYISNLSPQAQSISFQFNRLTDTVKIPLLSGSAAVPASGAVTIQFDPEALGLSGNIVEAVVKLPFEPPASSQLQPSLNLLQGDNNGGLLPLVVLTVGDFGFVSEEQVQLFKPKPQQKNIQSVPSNLFSLTWGLVDIPEAEEGIQVETSIWLSSLSNQTEKAIVTVNRLIEGTTNKENVLTETVNIPAGQAEEVRVEGVEGSAVEVIIFIPFAAPPLPVLPLLTPSLTVTRRVEETGTADLVLFLSPGQALFTDR